jgi:hypothetical protein
MEEQDKFCPHCGTKYDNKQEPETPAYQNADSYDQPSESYQDTGAGRYPMKWHKFLMVVMIIGAILTVINGVSTMSGWHYTREGVDVSAVYWRYPGLKSCDMAYGIILIALGVFQFTVRNRLNQFRSDGPRSLKILYILAIAASLIYLAWASAATGMNMFDSTNLGTAIGNLIMLFINSSYYAKRSELFVN